MLKNKIFTFLLKTENNLELIVSDELKYRWKYWLRSLKRKPNKVIENIDFKISITPWKMSGIIKLDLEFNISNENWNLNSMNSFLEAFQKEIILKNISITEYSILLGEIPKTDIILEEKKVDFFRLKEEIEFYRNQLNKNKLKYITKLSKKISNISILITDNSILKSNRKHINDLALKIINELNNGEKRPKNFEKLNVDILFQIIFLKDNILFSIKIINKSFLNLILKKEIKQHLTPIAPHIANSMISSSLSNIISKLCDRNDFKESSCDLVMIDPFCGFGTIPILLYHRSNEVFERFKEKGIHLNSFYIVGFDKDENSINNSVGNLKKIQKIYDLEKVNISALIDFYNLRIEDLIEESYLNFPFEIKYNTILCFITQPPYGFINIIGEEELNQIYFKLIEIISILAKKHMINLTLITGRADILKNNIEVNNKNQEMKLKTVEINELKKKNQKYSIFTINSIN